MKKGLVAILVTLMAGCTTLDSKSDFSDVVAQVETKQNYYLVEGKLLTPEFEANQNTQLTQATLALNYIVPNHQVAVPSSFIAMEVKYFKNYSSYKYVELEGKVIPLKALAPIAEACSDICTQRQLVKFDVPESVLKKAEQQGLNFALVSSEKNKVVLHVAAGYIKAIRSSARNQSEHRLAPMSVETPVKTEPVKADEQKSKPQEMAIYWYDQLDKKQQQSVTNWAVSHRNSSNAKLKTTNQAEQMFSYWFNQASESEKKLILIDLINK